MESSLPELIVPRGGQGACHTGNGWKGSKLRSTKNRHARRTVSVVNARDTNDASGSRGREVPQYQSHSRCSDVISKLECLLVRSDDILI